jgi:hypothetical protein
VGKAESIGLDIVIAIVVENWRVVMAMLIGFNRTFGLLMRSFGGA